MIPDPCGYARVSKTDASGQNLDTQIHVMQEFGIREQHIVADEMTAAPWGVLQERSEEPHPLQRL